MKELTKKQREEQEKLLREGSGWDCYFLAREIKGANIQALSRRCAEVGEGLDCYYFAKLQGADVQALSRRCAEVGGGVGLLSFCPIKRGRRAST